MTECFPKFRTKVCCRGNTHCCLHKERVDWKFVWCTMVLCNSFEVIYDSWPFHSLFINSWVFPEKKLRKDAKYTIRLHTSQANACLHALWRTEKILTSHQQSGISTQRVESLPKTLRLYLQRNQCLQESTRDTRAAYIKFILEEKSKCE